MNNIEIYGLKGEGTFEGFRLKSAKTRGGVIRNIWIHDVEMDGVPRPFYWELNWFPEYSYPQRPTHLPESEWSAHWHVLLTPVYPPERGIPEFYNLRVTNVKVRNAEVGIYANGYPEKPIRNVTFENVSIEAKSAGSLNHCRDWSMTNVLLRADGQVKLNNWSNIELRANSTESP